MYCSFKNSTMMKCNFEGSVLHHSDFTGADLRGVRFDSCNLSFCNFKDAVVNEKTSFYGADLKGAVNLPLKTNLEGAHNVLHSSLRNLNDYLHSITYPQHRRAYMDYVALIIKSWKKNYKKPVFMYPSGISNKGQISLDTDKVIGGTVRGLFGQFIEYGFLHIGRIYKIKANFDGDIKRKERQGVLLYYSNTSASVKFSSGTGTIKNIPIAKDRNSHLFSWSPVTKSNVIPCYEVNRGEFGTIAFDGNTAVVSYRNGDYEIMHLEALYDEAIQKERILTIPHPKENIKIN